MNIKQFIHKWKLGYAVGILIATILVGGGKLAFDYVDNHSSQSQPCDIIYKNITIILAPGEEWYVGQTNPAYIFDYDYYSANYTNGDIIASSNCFTDYPLHDVIKPGVKYVISKSEPLQYPFCIFENRLAQDLYPPPTIDLNQTNKNNMTETIIITLEKCKV